MPKIMQNIVVLMEPSEESYYVSLKAGKMYMNRFCIDEDDAFELSGVYALEKSPSFNILSGTWNWEGFPKEKKNKGKGILTAQNVKT